MEEKLYGLVIGTNGMAEIVEFPKEDKLGWYYKTIGCDLIDIVKPYGLEEVAKEYDLQSMIGKFSLVVDDEGLLKPEPEVNPIASLLYGCDDHGQALFGTVVVVKDEETPEGLDSVGMDGGDMMLLQAAINSLIERHNEKVGEANG